MFWPKNNGLNYGIFLNNLVFEHTYWSVFLYLFIYNNVVHWRAENRPTKVFHICKTYLVHCFLPQVWDCLGVWFFFVVVPNICFFSMELVSFHLSGTYGFEVDARFVENLCTPALDTKLCRSSVAFTIAALLRPNNEHSANSAIGELLQKYQAGSGHVSSVICSLVPHVRSWGEGCSNVLSCHQW